MKKRTVSRPSLKQVALLSCVAIAASAITLVAVRARGAGIPDPASALTYTGYLEDAAGAPLAGKHAIAVNFWPDKTNSGKPLCVGKLEATTELQAGRFQVPLPKDCADAVNANPSLWVDVEVDGTSLGPTALGAVPYALQAGHAADAAIVSEWTAYSPKVTGNPSGAVVQNVTATGAWRRVGDSIDISILTTATGVPGGDGFFQWSLPAGVKIDLVKAPSGVLGIAGTYTGSIVSCYSTAGSGGLLLDVQCHGNGAFVGPNIPAPWAKGSALHLQAHFPVVGWSLNK